MTAIFADRFSIVREDLHRRFGGSVEAREIDRVVDETIQAHTETSTVDEFLPVLVEREARAVLFEMGVKRPEVLFASKNNAARAQLAMAYLRHLAGDKIYARSVAVESQIDVDPLVLQVLEERGISTNALYLKEDVARTAHRADVIVLLGVDETPDMPGKRYEKWDLKHPRDLEQVRSAADFVESKVRELIRDLGVEL
ncbi:protein tyrosine phosphatase [Corynebacterium breve]|uniref:Protein tyrosine phosphatase n=1 Tax=Corynebacterium breve TaxID=3049799 RepID=A0ABY8VCZ1_9CORY|nr:protein tyrosine phosphatase [Corynebacterium breve]WIM67516.1 protein tyrosine phosphatase [Corynebacterium breve]